MSNGRVYNHPRARNTSIIKLDTTSRAINGKKENQPCIQCRKKKIKCRITGEPPCTNCLNRSLQCQFGKGSIYYLEHAASSDHIQREVELKDKIQGNENPTAFSNNISVEECTRECQDFFFEDEFDDFLNSFFNQGSSISSEKSVLGQRIQILDDKRISYQFCNGFAQYDPYLRFVFQAFNSESNCQFQNKTFKKIGEQLTEPLIFSGVPIENTKDLKKGSLVQQVDEQKIWNYAYLLVKYKKNILSLFSKFALHSLPIFDMSLSLDRIINEENCILCLILFEFIKQWESFDTYLHWIDLEFTEKNKMPTSEEVNSFILAYLNSSLTAPSLDIIRIYILYLELLGSKKFISNTIMLQTMLANTMNNLCYALGLNLDSSKWHLTDAERTIRTKIWWVNFLEVSWLSCCLGFPNPITEANSNMTYEIEEKDSDVKSSIFFEKFIRLTNILNLLKKDLFAPKNDNDSKTLNCRICEEYEAVITEWDEHLEEFLRFPSSHTGSKPLGVGSLRMAYYVLKILIMRARFREIGPKSFVEIHLEKSVSLLSDIVSFLTSLKISDVAGFWYSFTGSHFIYIKDFALFLILVSSYSSGASRSLILYITRTYKEWLETNAKCLSICWPALLRLNVATGSIGKQFNFAM